MVLLPDLARCSKGRPTIIRIEKQNPNPPPTPSSSLSSSSCSSALAKVSVMSWTLSLRYYALECHFGILPRPQPLPQLQMHNRSFSTFYRHRNRSQQLQQLNPHFCSTLSVFFAFVFVTVVTDSNRVRLFI